MPDDAMRLDDDHFTLFGLPPRFALDRSALDARWRALQGEVHPDRFTSEGAAAQRVAMQWALRVNEAYAVLKDPLKRGAYLCELRGAPIAAENNTAMPAAFLMQQMEWREQLDDARGLAAVQRLDDEIAPEDVVFEGHGVKVLIDPKSLPYLVGTELDFVREGLNEGFKFHNPREKDRCGCGESFRV